MKRFGAAWVVAALLLPLAAAFAAAHEEHVEPKGPEVLRHAVRLWANGDGTLGPDPAAPATLAAGPALRDEAAAVVWSVMATRDWFFEGVANVYAYAEADPVAVTGLGPLGARMDVRLTVNGALVPGGTAAVAGVAVLTPGSRIVLERELELGPVNVTAGDVVALEARVYGHQAAERPTARYVLGPEGTRLDFRTVLRDPAQLDAPVELGGARLELPPGDANATATPGAVDVTFGADGWSPGSLAGLLEGQPLTLRIRADPAVPNATYDPKPAWDAKAAAPVVGFQLDLPDGPRSTVVFRDLVTVLAVDDLPAGMHRFACPFYCDSDSGAEGFLVVDAVAGSGSAAGSDDADDGDAPGAQEPGLDVVNDTSDKPARGVDLPSVGVRGAALAVAAAAFLARRR